MDLRNRILNNLALNGLGRIAQSLAPLLLLPLMISSWGLDGYGYWLIVTAIPAYLLFSPDLGVGGAAINRTAYQYGNGELKSASMVFRTAISFSVAYAGLVLFALYLILDTFSLGALGIDEVERINVKWVVVVVAAQIFSSNFANLISAIYRCAESSHRYQYLHAGHQIGNLIFSLVALSFGASFETYAFVGLLVTSSYLGVVLIDSWHLRKTISWERVNGIGDIRVFRELLHPAIGHAGLPLIHAIQNQGVLLVLSVVVDASAVAIFQTIRVVSNAVKTICSMLSTVVLVELPLELGKNRTAVVFQLLVRSFQFSVILMGVFVSTLWVIGPVLFDVWLSQDLIPYESLYALLLISTLPFVLAQPHSIYLLALNKVHQALVPLLAVAMAGILLVFASVSWLGLNGVGVSLLLWEFGMMGIWMYKSPVSPILLLQKSADYESLIAEFRRLINRGAKF